MGNPDFPIERTLSQRARRTGLDEVFDSKVVVRPSSHRPYLYRFLPTSYHVNQPNVNNIRKNQVSRFFSPSCYIFSSASGFSIRLSVCLRNRLQTVSFNVMSKIFRQQASCGQFDERKQDWLRAAATSTGFARFRQNLLFSSLLRRRS